METQEPKNDHQKNPVAAAAASPGLFPPIFLSVACIVAGFVVVFILSGFIEKHRPPLPANYEDEDLALQGSKLKGYTLGFDGLMADWYWMRSLQYIGDKLTKDPTRDINVDDLRSLDPRLLYPYLDNATDLDPQFIAVYQYGAVVLPAIDPEKAIKFSEKGIANNPHEWRLYQHLGYIYWRLKRYDEAAGAYAAGARIEGAPMFMPMMAASMKTQGGSRETARSIYRQMAENSDDSVTRENAERRLLQLDALDEIEAMQAAILKFKDAHSRCPNGWNEILSLMAAEKLLNGLSFRINERNVPVDPTGVPYVYSKTVCDVGLDETQTNIPRR